MWHSHKTHWGKASKKQESRNIPSIKYITYEVWMTLTSRAASSSLVVKTVNANQQSSFKLTSQRCYGWTVDIEALQCSQSSLDIVISAHHTAILCSCTPTEKGTRHRCSKNCNTSSFFHHKNSDITRKIDSAALY